MTCVVVPAACSLDCRLRSSKWVYVCVSLSVKFCQFLQTVDCDCSWAIVVAECCVVTRHSSRGTSMLPEGQQQLSARSAQAETAWYCKLAGQQRVLCPVHV
jgi:hypothetical protein